MRSCIEGTTVKRPIANRGTSTAATPRARQPALPDLETPPTDVRTFDPGDDRTAGDVLRRIRREARDETEKGEWFEELFMRIARTTPEFAVREIHRWKDWPDRSELTGLDGRDIGVDLVAVLTDGSLVAVQCKCYDETHTVSKRDIDSFVTASQTKCFDHRWVVSTAKPGRHAAAVVGAPDSRISWIDFRFHRDRPVDAAADVRPVRDLFPLQQEAADVTIEGLKNHDRGTLVMACGTGKTFTALRIAEQIVPAGGTILFSAPSIALVSQARREWLRHCENPLVSLVVCSDPSAGGRASSREDIRRSELECPVTTDPQRIADFAAAKRPETKVVFSTYQSLHRVNAARIAEEPIRFDLAIADEAHRTTGARSKTPGADSGVDFQAFHDADRLRARKRLYMTATPRVYHTKSRLAAEKRNYTVVDMSDEAVYGPQLHRLSFKKAVEAGMLSDYRVIVLGVHEDALTDSIRKLEDENGKVDELLRVMGVSLAVNGLARGGDGERAPGRLNRTLAFANTIKRSDWYAGALAAPAMKSRMTRELHREHEDEKPTAIESVHLDASWSAADRKHELDLLQAAGDLGREHECRIICNCRLFSEGVDVPNLNSVAFLDGKKSQIDVVQAVGRVMRKAEGKQFGYVVVPVVVNDGDDVTTALERTGTEGYKAVGQVLAALQAHDERLMDNLKSFLHVQETTNGKNGNGRGIAPGEPNGSGALKLAPVEGDAIYAHVAAASGLNNRGLDEAADIGETVKYAAQTIGAAELTDAVADALNVTVEAAGGEKTVDRIAALLIMNACLLEQRLRATTDIGRNLGRDMTGAAENPISEMRAAWELILEKDYTPVFKPALAVLGAVEARPEIRRAVRAIHRTATRLATGLSELGYDYAGPLYHKILGTAKSDGAFYTKNTSGVMLARLALGTDLCDWSDPEAVRKLRVMDPACGTGTLLMAALQTIKERAAAAGGAAPNDPDFHRTVVEDVICGLDINAHAVQLAACNLTLGAPTVDYSRMNVARAPHGPQENGEVRLGTIELLRGADDPDSLAGLVYGARPDTPEGSRHVDTTGEFKFPGRDLDVVIMNPPFSSNQNKSEKFSPAEKKAMQARENETKAEVEHRNPAAGELITANSVRTFFTPIAEHALNADGGVLGTVIPVTACTSESGLAERRFLADRFQIERIITSHDPKSPNFSEKPVSIHEALLIARRREGGTTEPTEFVSLTRFPGHEMDPTRAIRDAQNAADDIAAGRTADWGTLCRWPADRMKAGDWTPAQWHDASLAETIRGIENNKLLEPVGNRFEIGPAGQRVADAYEPANEKDDPTTGGPSWESSHGNFVVRERPYAEKDDGRAENVYAGQSTTRSTRSTVPGFKSVSSKLHRTLRSKPDTQFVPRPGKAAMAAMYAKRRRRVLVAMKLDTISGRLSGLWSEVPSFGWWVPVDITNEDCGKALVAWWNSTPARLMLLNRRARKLTYPVWQVAHLRQIRTPKPGNPGWTELRAAFEEVQDMELLPMKDAERCPVRLIIDRAAAKAMNVPEETVADWRRQMAHEPTVSNKSGQ